MENPSKFNDQKQLDVYKGKVESDFRLYDKIIAFVPGNRDRFEKTVREYAEHFSLQMYVQERVENGKRLLEKAASTQYEDTTDHFYRRYYTTYSEPDKQGYITVESRIRSADPDQPKQFPVLYWNKIHPGKKIMRAMLNDHDEEDTNWDDLPYDYKMKNEDIAEPLHNSSILWHQFHPVEDDDPSTKIIRDAVTNDDPPTKIIRDAVTNDDTSEMAKALEKLGKGRSFPKGSDGYYAMIQTSNLVSSPYMLEQFRKDHEVTLIELKPDDDCDLNHNVAESGALYFTDERALYTSQWQSES